MKKCTKCNRDFPADRYHFFKDSIANDGFQAACKECYGHKFSHPIVIPKQGYKICSECGNEKLKTIEYFNPSKWSKDELTGKCRGCTAKHCKSYQESNKEYISEHQKQYQKSNKETISKQRKLYRESNKESIAAQLKKWCDNNVEHRRLYRETNKEYIAKRHKQYREDHKEVISKRESLWAKNNLDKLVMKSQKRRARERQLPHTLTPEQWKTVKQYFNGTCVYCGEEKTLTIDHFIPAMKSGELGVNNVLPACSSCNSSKGIKSFSLWYPKQLFYNKSREQKILKYLNYKNGIQQLALL